MEQSTLAGQDQLSVLAVPPRVAYDRVIANTLDATLWQCAPHCTVQHQGFAPCKRRLIFMDILDIGDVHISG